MSVKFWDVVVNGVFSCPANKRYQKNCCITCDRCKKTNIVAAVGYLEQDLCLQCVQEVIDLQLQLDDEINGKEMTLMASSLFCLYEY